MYPGTLVRWHDESNENNTTVAASNNLVLFLTAASFNKGPEEMKVVTGNEFFTYYGSTMDFSKNGQVALQAANIAKAGGSLLVKRVVADDSTLANVALVAKLVNTKILTKAVEGASDTVTLADLGVIGGDATTKYTITTSTSKITWEAVTETALKTYESIETAVIAKYPVKPTPVVSEVATGVPDQTSVTSTAEYPIAIITDNGRGVSSKSIKVSPVYNNNITSSAFMYKIYAYEGTTVTETATGTFDPHIVISNIVSQKIHQYSLEFITLNLAMIIIKLLYVDSQEFLLMILPSMILYLLLHQKVLQWKHLYLIRNQ